MVFATLSQKRCLKKQTQKHGFSKTPKLPVVDEYLANYKHSWTWSKKPPENKRHTPRGGRRTCYLVVVVVVCHDLRGGFWSPQGLLEPMQILKGATNPAKPERPLANPRSKAQVLR